MDILKALRAGEGSKIAFTGAGGKTTSMFALARLLPAPVLLTTSTHLAPSQALLADRHFSQPEPPGSDDLTAEVLLFSGPISRDGRLGPPTPRTLAGLHRLSERYQYPLLVEADGARMLPLKAPGAHEPVVPDFCELAVVCAGLSALGQPLSEALVHRPEIYSDLTGLAIGDPIDPASIVRALSHPLGGLKGIPAAARRVVLLNQADTPALQARGGGMAASLLEHFEAVLTASMRVGQVYAAHQRVAGVVLAAGGSARLGRPKQLLAWRGRSLVRQVAETALESGLSPVVVVTGAAREGVENELDGLNVVIHYNPAWQAGQSTSVRAGLKALPDATGAAVFLLSDQPFVSPGLVRGLVETHASTLAPIVAPLIDGQRGNPVLFDRRTFADFEKLEGDAGARPLFARYQANWVPWHDPRSGLDIDTQADYERLLGQD